MEALRAGHIAPELPPQLKASPEPPQNADRVLRIPEWLPRKKPAKKESAQERCSTAAA